MSYPQRVEWRFRNVYGAFDFYPTLESIDISQEAPDVVATLSCTVVDGGQGWAFGVEDEVRVFCDDVRIFGGHLKVVTEDRVDEFGPRMWRLEAQDYTAKLGDAIIRQRQQRKAESLARRVRWIVSYLKNAWHIDGRDFKLPSEQVERADMFGMSVAEALDSTSNEETGLRYWIDADNVLNIRRDEQSAAPFALDNDAPDYVTSFPFREFTYRRASDELANAILVEPEKREDARWSAAAGNIANYAWGDSTGRQELFISAEEIRTARGATRHGMAQLQRTKVADGEGHLVCFQPGIWAGMTVSLREALWDHDQSIRVIRVDISAVDPDDAEGKAYMRCELTLSNKPKRRSPKMGRPEAETTANTTPATVDDFTRVVDPPARTAGDALGVTPVKYGLRTEYRAYGVSQYPDPATLETSGPTTYGPTARPSVSATQEAGSYIGADATPHTRRPPGHGCGGLEYWYAGWRESEVWYRFDILALPSGMAGMTGEWSSSLGAGAGVAGSHGLDIVARSSAPTGTRQGEVIGRLPAGGTTDFFVPARLIPAAGGELWIGLRAAWSADLGDTYCGFTTPRQVGVSNSGYFATTPWPTAMTWSVVSGDDIDWGTASEGHVWQDAGSEGSPTAGMDGESFYVSGEGGQGIALTGDLDDDEVTTGAWSDTTWATTVTFTASSLAAGGSIQLTSTGQGQQTIATIDLGAAPGISVQAPTAIDSAEADIGADEVWVAKFDSRSGWFRGKVWKLGEPEPAEWGIEVEMSETEDEADVFALWVRAATGQDVRVLDVTSEAGARNGQQVLTELIGHASGTTNRFVTSHRYRDGTLEPIVNGIVTPALIESGSTTEFRLDHFPTAGSVIRASYIADTGE